MHREDVRAVISAVGGLFANIVLQANPRVHSREEKDMRSSAIRLPAKPSCLSFFVTVVDSLSL